MADTLEARTDKNMLSKSLATCVILLYCLLLLLRLIIVGVGGAWEFFVLSFHDSQGVSGYGRLYGVVVSGR